MKFSVHSALRAPGHEWDLSAFGVSDLGEAILLWRGPHGHLVTRTDQPGTAIEVKVGGLRNPAIAEVGDGGFVISDTRDLIDEDPLASAAWVFDADGAVAAAGSLGDGVEQLLTTPDGGIWVGYSDRAVCEGGETEHHGLVRFGPDLRPEWLFPYGGAHGAVENCTVLNVSGDTATSYFWQGDFAIAQTDGRDLSSWSHLPGFANALLVDERRFVLLGGRGQQHDRVISLAIRPDGVDVEWTGRSTGLPVGESPLCRVCRGREMHVVIGRDWYRTAI